MKKLRQIIILGAGGHAAVVIEIARLLGFEPAAIYDDREETHGKLVAAVEVKGRIAALPATLTGHACIAIGNNQVRKSICERLVSLTWPVLVHPAACVSSQARLGAGTVVCAGAVIQPNAVIGRQGIVNIGACVDHDSNTGDFAHLSGRTYVGPGSVIGDETTLPLGVIVPAFSTWQAPGS